MAVSGAAMSPTSGYRTHPIKALFFGVLNARLGLWIGNPSAKGDVVARSRPKLGGFTVLKEMLDHRGAFDSWIHLSDGGHFENLGVYELLRRGCMRIVVVDSSCDPQRCFEDLANAIRRARIDLAVRVFHIGAWNIYGPEGRQQSTVASSPGSPDKVAIEDRAWTWFEIDYGQGLPRGRMLYIKPSVYHGQDLPVELKNYWLEEPLFPHESTADQFFSERQVEAYRALGELCTDAALGADKLAHDSELRRMVRRSLAVTPAAD
jgi:hypothetical protein